MLRPLLLRQGGRAASRTLLQAQAGNQQSRGFAKWAVKKVKRRVRPTKAKNVVRAARPASSRVEAGSELPFSNGLEAAEWVIARAIRKDDQQQAEFLDAIGTIVPSLIPVFDRKPSHALIMAQMLEPEKAFEFRDALCPEGCRVYRLPGRLR